MLNNSKMKKKVYVQLDADLFIKGKARAAVKRQKFNGYIESLIEKDYNEYNTLKMSEKHDKQS